MKKTVKHVSREITEKNTVKPIDMPPLIKKAGNVKVKMDIPEYINVSDMNIHSHNLYNSLAQDLCYIMGTEFITGKDINEKIAVMDFMQRPEATRYLWFEEMYGTAMHVIDYDRETLQDLIRDGLPIIMTYTFKNETRTALITGYDNNGFFVYCPEDEDATTSTLMLYSLFEITGENTTYACIAKTEY